MLSQLRVILSGGGTGGHIFPAIAIANEIKLNFPDTEFLFVGAEGRLEMEKVPAAGYKIIGLWISGFQRKITLGNFLFPFKVISSLLKAKKIINEFKPDVVIGTGGYASGPTLRAATSKGIPTLIQEQNSYPGITNKILSGKVNKICVAYEGMEKFFPKDKILLTGNPIRQDISNNRIDKEEACAFFGLNPNKKTILVIGGSLGARTINNAIGEKLEALVKNDTQLLWQTGKNYIDKADQQCKTINSENIKAHAFITRMDMAYVAADIIISRAGASSVSELCLIGKPTILVPSPNVAEDHQTKNAKALINKNATILIKDVEAHEKLISTALTLLQNPNQQALLSKNIKAMALPNSAKNIAAEVLKLAKR